MSLKLTYHSPTLLPPNVICQFYAQRSFYRKIRSLRVWLTQEGKTSNILKLEVIERLKRKQTAKKIIIASNYQLDFEAIFGAIEDV